MTHGQSVRDQASYFSITKPMLDWNYFSVKAVDLNLTDLIT